MRRRIITSIVNWNTRDDLRRCLAALERASVPGLEPVVVDNASTDGSADMVQREFPSVRLIRSGTNLGFAGGNNLVLGEGEADYFLVLNPDIQASGEAIEQLVECLESHPDAAAAAPALVGDDGNVQSHLYRRFPGRAQIVLYWTILRPVSRLIGPLRRRIFEHDLRGDRVVEVDQLPGAAMLIRGSAIRTVGMLDAGYFMWWEDVDWCYRAVHAGLHLYVVPAARVRHTGGSSFAAWSIPIRVFQFYRAFYRFMAVHGLHDLMRAVTPIILADLAIKGAVLHVTGAGGDGGLKRARQAVREAVRDPAHTAASHFSGSVAITAQTACQASQPHDERVVDVIIVNWNGRRWLDRCIRALRSSTIPVRITLVDNDSTDGSADHAAAFADVDVIRVGRNAGYAGGANVGLRRTHGAYAFVMNPDVIVDPDHLEVLCERLDTDSRIGAAQGKLYSFTAAEFEAGTTPRGLIDSAGHVMRRSRMVVDRGQGRPDAPEFDREVSVFSACGAALFLRRRMLEDLAPDGEFFGESFFAYKEDIDLCWRARILGWDVRYVPQGIAHHVRALPLTAGAWRQMSPTARRHSWKNHYLLMLRNDRVVDLLRALPFIAAWELLRLGHAVFRDWRVLGAYRDAAREIPQALRYRSRVLARRRAAARDLRRWFGGEPVPVDQPAPTRRQVA